MRRGDLLLAVLAAALASGACGDDEGGGGPAQPGGGAGGGAAAKVDLKAKLIPRRHVEDSVQCVAPDRPTGPACEPPQALGSGSAALLASTGAGSGSALADCDLGRFCLSVGSAYSCEACPERDRIRHVFKDRDFVSDQSRDPFYNYVVLPAGLATTTNPERPEPHESCRRPDQFVATSYSFKELKLIGIVTMGAQRKVLMTDSAGHGNIIKRGDCVGTEKAVVKDIGAGYITFVVSDELDSKRPPQETSVPLHPNGLDVDSTDAGGAAGGNGGAGTPDQPPPIVAPPPARK